MAQINRVAMFAEAQSIGNRWRVEVIRDDGTPGSAYYLVEWAQVERVVGVLDELGFSFALSAFQCDLRLAA